MLNKFYCIHIIVCCLHNRNDVCTCIALASASYTSCIRNHYMKEGKKQFVVCIPIYCEHFIVLMASQLFAVGNQENLRNVEKKLRKTILTAKKVDTCPRRLLLTDHFTVSYYEKLNTSLSIACKSSRKIIRIWDQ